MYGIVKSDAVYDDGYCRYTGVPVAGEAGVPVMRYLKRNRVVATTFAAAHLVDLSPAFTGLQDSESATPMTTCQSLYSGWVAPDTNTTSPALVPVLAPVPVRPTTESAAAPERFIKSETEPLCTVTVSLLRKTRRAASATVVSVDRAAGRPPASVGARLTIRRANFPAPGGARIPSVRMAP